MAPVNRAFLSSHGVRIAYYHLVKRLGFALLLLSGGAISRAAELPAVLSNVYLASKLGTDRILIHGGSIRSDVNYDRFPRVPGEPDSLYGASLPRVTPAWLATVSIDRPTKWRIGDKWKLYTGAGEPVDILIADLVVADRNASAVARFAEPKMANRVAGLTATQFLAVRAPGLAAISVQPLVLFLGDSEQAETKATIEKAALNRSRQLVASEAWKTRSKELASEARRLDEVFLQSQTLSYDLHMARWRPSGHKALLFAQIVWRGRSHEAIFGANVILEEGEVLSILDFDSRPGEEMRVGDNEQANTWDFYEPVFLNAWGIGNRLFVLKFTRYYESIRTDLMELVSPEGLVSTGLYSYAGP